MPHCGIHGIDSTNWNPAKPSSNPRRMLRETKNVRSDAKRANDLIGFTESLGKNISTTAAMIGIQMIAVNVIVSVPYASIHMNTTTPRKNIRA